MGRAPCCDKVGLKRGRWTTEEDEILLNYIKANGEGSWRAMPKNAGLLRCGKSCRLRWINYLRADLKRGNILKEEEETIIKLHATMGNRWSLIAGHLPGRTDNEIKNYWNSHLSRRVDSFIRTNEKDIAPVVGDVGKLASVGKRRGGRTSRSAMKKTCLYAKSIRRENEGKSGSNIPTSSSVQSAEGSNMLLDCIRRENEGKSGSNIPTSSSVQSAEGSNMLLDCIIRENEGKRGSNIPTSSSVQSAEGSNMLLDCIRRENEGKSGSNIHTSSSVQSAEGSSMLLDFGLDEGLLGFEQEIGEMLLSPTSMLLDFGVDEGLLGFEQEIGDMLLSPTSQLVERRIWENVECEELFGASEERERGVMSSSEERGGGALVEKEGGVVSLKEERGGVAKVGEMVEWDLEGLKEKLWDDEGYMLPWVWDNGRGDLDFQSVEGSGYNEEMLDTCLVSDL